MMLRRLKRFLHDPKGAVTVDWMVLSAAVIGLGMVVLVPVAFSTESATEGITDYIAKVPVGYGNN